MFDTILFPTDGSDPAEDGLEYALQMATSHDATLHVLTVADTSRDRFTRIEGEVVDALEREGEATVERAAARARERDVDVVTSVVRGRPARAIVDYCRRSGADLVVMPTHGRRGLQRFLLGSVTERVINEAPVPVLTVNPDSGDEVAYPCRSILVPTDGSAGAALALETGIALASATDATLHVLHVVETGSLGPEARSVLNDAELTEEANELLARAAEEAATAGLDAVETTVATGDPARLILHHLGEDDLDLAILGTHGTTDFSRYVLGGVSSKVVRTAPVPVLWVRDEGSS